MKKRMPESDWERMEYDEERRRNSIGAIKNYVYPSKLYKNPNKKRRKK